MPAGAPARRRRRRDLGQHDLIGGGAVDRLVDGAGVRAGHLVIDVGAGYGPISDALVARGARVVAVELDRARAARLADRYAGEPRVRVVAGDALRVPLPRRPYAVVANPPFSITTALLRRLLDEPWRAPLRVDLVLEHRAVRVLTDPSRDPIALGWSPWFDVSAGPHMARHHFRPQPPCDAAVLTVRRRAAPLLAPELAPAFRRFVQDHHRRWAGPDRGATWWSRRFRSRT